MVSIITPTYNSAKYLEETIQSVLQQTYGNWEMIIIDDGSKDETIAIAKKYSKQDSRITLIQNPQNLGAAKTRNRGIEKAFGDFIAFLDSDDTWKPNKLDIQIEFMKKKDCALSFSSYHLIDDSSKEIGIFNIPKKILGYEDLLKTNSIGCLTAIYSVKKLGKVYMKNTKKKQDYTLWLQILKTHKAFGIEKSLANYRVGHQSLSSNKLKTLKYQFHIYRNLENLSFFQSIYYFIHYAFNGLNKYDYH